MFRRIELAGLLCAGICAWLAGCESPAWTHKLSESFGSTAGEAENHRREYASNRSRKSLEWLLAHELQPGMPYREVCTALGEEGERELSDRALKKSPLRVDDETYGWPDNQGHILYLFFREGRLIHFNPEDYE